MQEDFEYFINPVHDFGLEVGPGNEEKDSDSGVGDPPPK